MKKSLLALKKSILGPLAPIQLFLSFGIALILASIALSVDLQRVEAHLYDLRMRWKGTDKPHSEILVLPLSGSELEALDSIETHIELLENLIRQKPKAVLYFYRFEPNEIETKPAAVERFVELVSKAERSGIRVLLGTDVDISGEVLPPYPLSLLPHAPAILHKDGTMFGEDKVMRRALLTVGDAPTLHLKAVFPKLSTEELRTKIREIRGAYYYEPAKSWHMLIRYPGDTAFDKSPFAKLDFQQARIGNGLEIAKDKVVLIDTVRIDSLSDYAYTPYSRVIYSSPRLMVHASIVDTLLKESGLISVSEKIDKALTFLLALCLAFIAITMRPSRGVLALLLLCTSLLGLSFLLFQWGYWLPLVHPLLAMFFTYYLIVPYRAILEYKKRWEVQEKHDILVQVEEMKGNFLSLMSHDLKTPVAQIQGLAEMVMRQGGISQEQESELRQIIFATEKLDKFISKILNLTKVESNEIKLNKKSKDINKLLEQCAEKLSFQARQKEVELRLSLEPLFPIHVDAALLIQVFTNIIDNAIKYSPPGTHVSIRSREIDSFVEVMIEDRGSGIDEEEQEHVFTKFFRGKSICGSEANGSGLGLYLSRYFIELHKGEIRFETKKGSGSKFFIQLPNQGSSA